MTTAHINNLTCDPTLKSIPASTLYQWLKDFLDSAEITFHDMEAVEVTFNYNKVTFSVTGTSFDQTRTYQL